MDVDRQTIAHLITGEADNPVTTDTDTDETDKRTEITDQVESDGTEMVITQTTTTARRSVFVAIGVRDETDNLVTTDSDTDETDKQTQITDRVGTDGTEMVSTQTTTTARRSVFVAIGVRDETDNLVTTDSDTDETDKQTQITDWVGTDGTEMVSTQTTTTARRSVFVAIGVRDETENLVTTDSDTDETDEHTQTGWEQTGQRWSAHKPQLQQGGQCL